MLGYVSEDKRGGGLTLLLNAMGTEKETLYDVIYDDDGTYGDRDPLGRITRKTEWIVDGDEPGTEPRPLDAKTYDYGYNAEGRPWLESVAVNDNVVSSYGYDENGNRTSVELNWSQLGYAAEFDASLDETETDYNEADQLLTYGTKSYAWNNFGQLESMTDSATNETTEYEYDLFGNLLSVSLPDGRTIEYDVDGAGRRIGRRELDSNGNEISFKGWIYRDLLRPIAEVNALGEVVARYVYGDAYGTLHNGLKQLKTRTGANQDTAVPYLGTNVPRIIEFVEPGTGTVVRRAALTTNQIGTVNLVADVESGEVLQRIEYDPFGRVVFDSAPGFQPFGFAGGLYDTETELVRFGARDYVSELGRWASRDPVRFSGGANVYLYTGADPIQGMDPTGFQNYGTGDCSYYEARCEQNGGSYYCEDAPTWCDRYPDSDGWPNCTRQCLQECDQLDTDSDPVSPYYDDEEAMCVGTGEEPDSTMPWNPLNDNFACHASCYLVCFAGDGPGVPPSGPATH